MSTETSWAGVLRDLNHRRGPDTDTPAPSRQELHVPHEGHVPDNDGPISPWTSVLDALHRND